MKKCPYCDWPNTDDASICCNCRHFLEINSTCEKPKDPEPEKDYALRAFLLKNQKLFAIMGVFLIIALFFNNLSLLNFSTTPANSMPNSNIQTICNNQNFEQNCYGKFSLIDNTTDKPTNITNRSFQISCERAISDLNCTSNLTSAESGKTQNQSITEEQVKFFSFLSMILFLVIAFVVLIDAFTFIRIYEHAKDKDKRKGTIKVLKDSTIFLFIIPFVYLLVFFLNLAANGFGKFIPLGFLIGSISIYVAEIILVMYLVLRYLNSLEGNRSKEYNLVIICLLIGILSGLFFWFILPDSFIYTSTISLAFILMAIIAYIRPHIEK
ncbi:MAG: hypothetical protein WC626_08180 [Methanoregula sp.]